MKTKTNHWHRDGESVTLTSHEDCDICNAEVKMDPAEELTTAEIIKANRLETVKAARVIMHFDTFQNRFV